MRFAHLVALALALFLYSSILAAQESACFSPVADSYVQQSQAGTNFGGDSKLRLFWLDAGTDRATAYIRFDLSPIPSNAFISTATLSLYQESALAGANFSLGRVTSPWQEFSINWNNRPGSTGLFDNPTHSDDAGWKNWNALQPVSDWVSGAFSNYGFYIASGLLDAPTDFVSRQGTFSRKPKLCVDWTVGATTDLVVTGMEVTQAIQDLNNSVPLIAGKRTFVRLYARGTDKNYRTFAQLSYTCDNFGRILHPINNGNGYTVVKTSPDRQVLNDAFLFELPSDCTDEAESISITGFVNPVGYSRGRYPPESNITNNVTANQVFSFETVPPLDLKARYGKYKIGDTFYETDIAEVFQMRSWMLRAYPVSDITMEVSKYWMGDVSLDSNDNFDDPDSGKVNKDLRKLRKIAIDEYGVSKERIHYAMVTDEGGFMRGSAKKPVGSGPTGDSRFSWDTDGSYGDWYGAHEIGHALKRAHVNCNGKEKGPDSNYPHTGGLISGTTTGNNALFGFDSRPVPTIYGPTWSDVMSYCSNQWISDYTYEAIKNEIQDEFSAQANALAETQGAPVAADSYLIAGLIGNGQLQLDPVFLHPDVTDSSSPVAGDYSIALLAQNGSTLSSKTFMPEVVGSGPAPNDGTAVLAVNSLQFVEWIAQVPGTQQIEISGPSGVLKTIAASASPPTVNVVFPNGPTVVSGAGVTLQWSANDNDGDDIWFNVEFSPDNGVNWITLATGIDEQELLVDRDSLVSTSGANGLIRVRASDGFHTVTDVSDAPFTVASQAPLLVVNEPEDGKVISANQTLHLQADAWSDLAGVMTGDQLRWVSSVDGLLGTGDRFSVTELTPGTHVIVIVADDDTRISSTTRTVHVVEFPGQLPQTTLALSASPTMIPFRPDLGMLQADISIDTLGSTNALSWSAFETAPWLTLNRDTGSTPDQITATVDATGLAFGDYSANIVILSPDISGGGSKIVKVSFSLYAPNLLFMDGFEGNTP